MNEPKRFGSRESAENWLAEVGQTGIVHASGHGFIIITLDDRGVFAFTDTGLVLLPDW